MSSVFSTGPFISPRSIDAILLAFSLPIKPELGKSFIYSIIFLLFFFLNVHHRIILFLKDYFDKYYPTRFYFEFILTLEKTLENSGEKEEYTYIERNIENQLMLEGTKFGNTKM